MSNTKFKVGDRIMDDEGNYGVITSVDENHDFNPWYGVKMDNGEETFITEDILELSDVDKKTAFLTELKELMEKYGVEIDCGGEDPISDKWLKFIFSDGTITYDNEFRRNHKCFLFPITPSNIFDYDK